MIPRKIFEILNTVMTILVLFEQLLKQIFFKFFAHVSEFFTEYRYDAFCSHIFDLCVWIIDIEEVQNCGKTVFIKNIVENGWWGIASPASPSEFAPGTILLSACLKLARRGV